MSLTVRFTERAKADVSRNAQWWAEHHSLEQAIKWKDAVWEQMLALYSMPKRHGLAAKNPKFSFDLRQKLIGLGPRPTYRALFVIRDSVVLVLAVLRCSQDSFTPEGL